MDILSVGTIVELVDSQALFRRTDHVVPVRSRKFNGTLTDLYLWSSERPALAACGAA
jgi:hypothetical protein